MIADRKRQAIEGMAGTFSGAGDAARAVSDSEVEKLRSRAVVGQGLHRTYLALLEVWIRLLPCLPDRLGAGDWQWPVDLLLHHPSAPLGPCQDNFGEVYRQIGQ